MVLSLNLELSAGSSGEKPIMHEGQFYSQLENNKVQCHLCAHGCLIGEGKRGICQVRENRGGILYSLVYGRLVAENSDPVEKKPLFHFLPASSTFSISTVGCNLRCHHCQNSSISQYPREHGGAVVGTERTPQQVVALAKQAGCQSISYTYVEPTIFAEFALDCGELAQQAGLKNIFVSNGFMSQEAARSLATVVDGINIDIKAFDEDFYRQVCKAKLQPVLDSVRRFHDRGVWVEVTTLLIPGLNDSDEQLQAIARFLVDIDPHLPWHVTAFHPSYKMLNRPATPLTTLQRARTIGRSAGLHHVYAGNMPGEGGESTYCPGCGELLIKRVGYSIQQNSLPSTGHCPRCHARVAGVWS